MAHVVTGAARGRWPSTGCLALSSPVRGLFWPQGRGRARGQGERRDARPGPPCPSPAFVPHLCPLRAPGPCPQPALRRKEAGLLWLVPALPGPLSTSVPGPKVTCWGCCAGGGLGGPAWGGLAALGPGGRGAPRWQPAVAWSRGRPDWLARRWAVECFFGKRRRGRAGRWAGSPAFLRDVEVLKRPCQRQPQPS